MTSFACPRCLGAGVLITFDGKGAYACPSCAPPQLRKAAISLDCVNTLRALEAIDADVATEMTPSESCQWCRLVDREGGICSMHPAYRGIPVPPEAG